MQPSSASAAVWRCAVVLLALLAATQLCIEFFHAPRSITGGVIGVSLFEGRVVRERGPTRFVIDKLPHESPLRDLGVAPGDYLQWDEPLGRWYNLAAGEHASLTVIRGNDSRRVEVTMPPPAVAARHQAAIYIMNSVLKLAALVLGVLIGWRRPNGVAFRSLASGALLLANEFPYSAPAAAHVEWLDFLSSVAQELAIPTLVLFALNYPDDAPVGLRARLKRYYVWAYGAIVIATVVYFARLYSGFFEPGLSLAARTWSVALPALFLLGIVLAWRHARDETRARLQWILATLGTIIAAALIGTLNSLVGNPIAAEDIAFALDALMLAATIGFAYAILRRRIFDFGLAVNRTLVFAIVGAILLGIFQVAHGIATQMLHFDDSNKALLLSAILAVTVYLSFNTLKKHVERLVDRVFFSAWARAEETLKRFVKESSHVTESHALARLLVAALDRFCDGAGAAVYRIDAEHDFARGESTLANTPEFVDADDEVVLGMRAHREAQHIRDAASPLRAAIALPMTHRGDLIGFVLVGAQRNGDAYRADQVSAMESAVHRVGLDFYSLHVDMLERQLADEQRDSATLRAQLRAVMELVRARTA